MDVSPLSDPFYEWNTTPLISIRVSLRTLALVISSTKSASEFHPVNTWPVRRWPVPGWRGSLKVPDIGTHSLCCRGAGARWLVAGTHGPWLKNVGLGAGTLPGIEFGGAENAIAGWKLAAKGLGRPGGAPKLLAETIDGSGTGTATGARWPVATA